MLKLYEGTTSVCAIKVRLTLFEKGLAFESRDIDLRAGDQFEPEYLQLNPKGVVPTLDDGGRIVTESSVIQHYVEDAYPQPSLLPCEPFDRARMRLVMKRIDDEVHPSTGNLTHATVYRPGFLALNEETRGARLAKIPDASRRERRAAVYKEGLDAPIVVGAIEKFHGLISDMEAALSESGFLTGPRYSLADAAVTPYINRLADLGLLDLWAAAAPRVMDWFDAIQARPSFRLAVTDYLTESDKEIFGARDPQTRARVRAILGARI